jgi:pimeloyl-ACP methyl ester carboxylesterase
VPEPGAAVRDAPDLRNEARRDVPTVVICTSFSSDEIKAAVAEGYAWTGGIAELRNVTWVDLPTSHWPMWSRPRELAGIIGDVAKAHAS